MFVAYDTYYPTNQATSTLTITIDRNPGSLTCNPPSIVQVLDLQSLPGDVLATITATDPEGVSFGAPSCAPVGREEMKASEPCHGCEVEGNKFCHELHLPACLCSVSFHR